MSWGVEVACGTVAGVIVVFLVVLPLLRAGGTKRIYMPKAPVVPPARTGRHVPTMPADGSCSVISDMLKVLRGIEQGSDEHWRFIDGVCSNAEGWLVEPRHPSAWLMTKLQDGHREATLNPQAFYEEAWKVQPLYLGPIVPAAKAIRNAALEEAAESCQVTGQRHGSAQGEAYLVCAERIRTLKTRELP